MGHLDVLDIVRAKVLHDVWLILAQLSVLPVVAGHLT